MNDPVPTANRIRKRIAQMATQYQKAGRYMGLKGDWHNDATGILNAWEELDNLGAKLLSRPENEKTLPSPQRQV